MELNLTGTIIIFGVTLIAGLLAFRLAKSMQSWIKYLLSFSGAYLFGLTITHLLPEMYEHSHDTRLGIGMPVFILIGFFIQLILEQFSQGAEHGHLHIHENQQFPVTLLLALLIHALMEGALLSDHATDTHSIIENISPKESYNWNYLFGLSIHKIPIAVVLAILLRKTLKSNIGAILILALFSMATPIGTLVSEYLGAQSGMVLMALVSGSFLHISTTILFEASPNHKFNLLKFVLAIIGAGASFLL